MTRPARKYVKPLVFLLAGLAVFVLNRRYGWGAALAGREWLDSMRALAESRPWEAALLYLLFTVAGCVFLALPGAVFALIAGLLFGPLWGTLLCLAAAAAGASLAFLAGRYFLKDAVKPMVAKHPHLKRLLFDDIERSGMALLMITRLLPFFPYNLQNFAYGITDIGFWPYTLYSTLFMMPGAALFTVGAAGIGDSGKRWVYFSAAAVLAAVVSLWGLYLYRRYVGPARGKKI